MVTKRKLMFAAAVAYFALAHLEVAQAQDQISTVKGIVYGDKKEGIYHQLDLYLPARTGFATLVFVHGGAWCSGDKSGYEFLGRYLAEQGIGVALVNHRLSPWVKHPEHIKDVARAYRWVHDNIDKRGGAADNIFLGGYSAGGHLAALLATDDSYLRAEGVCTKPIRGVIAISGIYSHEEFNPPCLGLIFPAPTRERAFAMTHLRRGLAPFLIFHAEKEWFSLNQQARRFHEELRRHECDARLLVVKDTDHYTMSSEKILRERCGREFIDFIAAHVGSKKNASDVSSLTGFP